MFAADDKVVTRRSGTGTFEDEFMGRQPTGVEAIPSTESGSIASTTT
jgi:hypothetical protein